VTVTKPAPWPSRRVIRFTGSRGPPRCQFRAGGRCCY
jgi:hypothetical protein